MFKNRLLNTVAIPVLSMAVLAEPVAASAVSQGMSKTQSRQAEEGLIQLAQAVVCSDGSEADSQETCDARDAQAQAEAEAQAQAEAEAQAQAEAEAQAQAEAEAQAQAEAEAQAQAEAEAQAQAEAEAQAQAEAEAQAQAEAEAQAQAEAEAQAQAEAEAQAQAEAEAQAQAEAEAQAQAEAEAQQKQEEADAEAQRQAEAEAQAQAEADAQAQAEADAQAQQEAEQAAEQATPESVTCADGSTAPSEGECPVAPETQTEEASPEQQPAEEPAEEQATPAQDETEQQPADQQAETPAESDADGQQTTEQEAPATDGAADGTEAQTEGEAPADGNAAPEQATDQTEQAPTEEVVVPAVEPPEDQPVEEITDNRTEEEKQQIAEDPSQSTETVVLPVDNGAAVLDSDKDADNSGGETAREERTQLRAQEDVAPPPETDADAQQNVVQVEPETVKATIAEEGTRLQAEPTFDVPTTVVNNVTNVTNITNNTTNNTVNNTTNNTIIQNNVVNQVTEIRVVEQVDNRTVINVGNQIIVRGDDRQRLRYDAEESYYEELPRGRTRETIIREDGSRIVTVYNRYGDIVIRSRISPRGREYVLMYSPEADNERPQVFIDVGLSLPPMRLTVPVQDYIISTSRAPDRDYYDFLARPPVERVERVYSIDEVKSSARLRDKVRRIDLDTITFPTGSAEVPLAQAKTLRKVAAAMTKLLDKDPGEVFLIEGHTDAVGADKANLILSDKRAAAVANLLTEVYGIPPENMSVQGYGERYLKIRTQAAEQQNRRVAIRRVTSLVRPANVSSND